MSTERLHDCPTCICGRRAPVQATHSLGRGPGTIAWAEHLLAFSVYAVRYGGAQSAERIARHGGFDFEELVTFLGRGPETWEPERSGT